MKVLLLGSGAAMHTLAWKFLSEPQVGELFCIPGNAGTALLLGPPPVPADARLPDWAFSHGIELVVSQGPRWVETFIDLHIPVLGATERARLALRGRRALREILRRASLAGAEGESFTDADLAERYLAGRSLPVWLRAEHGPWHHAVLVRDRHAAFAALRRMLEHAEGHAVAIERAYTGPSVLFALLSDGEHAIPFGASRVAVHRFEGESGPLTEGMGAWAPAGPLELERQLYDQVGRPLVAALRTGGLLRPGFLQLRLTVTGEGPVVEDVAWGLDDLHAAAVFPLWEGEIASVLRAAAQGCLDTVPRWKREHSVAVALVASGYPDRPQTGYPLQQLDAVDALVFHQATCLRTAERLPSWGRGIFAPRQREEGPGEVVADGGRILFVVGRGKEIAEAREEAYRALRQIRCPQATWRNDIAREEP